MSEEVHPSSESSEAIHLPPPTFEFLVLSFKTQAELHLGLVTLPGDEQAPRKNPRLARHTIDMLAMLAQKTKGNLSYEEQRLIDNSLTELRFRYVQVLEAQKTP